MADDKTTKTPEQPVTDSGPGDAYRFMAETEAVLQRKELMDDPAQPAPASGKEEFYLSKNDDVLLTPEQIAAEERRWLFDAPIAELAEVKGVSIDEAVKIRTDAVLQEEVVPITVSVRPIEPQGKLIGFASVNFGGVVIDDFKVVDGKNGIFLGAPSKPDPASRTGYRATVRIPDRATQERINAAGVEAYHAAVEQLVARAQAVRPAPIKEQMAEAAKQAGKEEARPRLERVEADVMGKLLTMDEVLRLPISKALIIIRGRKLLQVGKCDYTKHPESKKMISCKASAHIPEWQKKQPKEVEEVSPAPVKKPGRKKRAPTSNVVPTDKDSIMSKN